MDRSLLTIDVDRRGYGWRYRMLPVDSITRTELLIDPADGRFAGECDTLRTPSRLGLATGTVVLCTTVSDAVVDALGDLPR